MKKALRKISKWLGYLLALALVCFFVFVKLQRDYNDGVIRYSVAMVKQTVVNKVGTVVLGPVFTDGGKKSEEVVSYIGPGSVVNGQFFLANSKDKPAEVKLSFEPLECGKDDAECKSYKLFDSKMAKFIDVEGDTVYLRAHEVRIVDFQLNVPKNVVNGIYYTGLMLIDKESKQVVREGAKYNLVVAYKIKFKVNVVDDPEKHELVRVLDDPKKLAMNYVLTEVRLAVAVIFGILAIGFLYRAYRKK